MKNKTRQQKAILIFLINLLLIFLNACETLPTLSVENSGAETNVRITMPEDGSDWPVGKPITIYSVVSSPNTIIGITLLVNDEQPRQEDLFTQPGFTRGTITQIWTPMESGVFTVQTIVRDNLAIAESNVIEVHVTGSSQITITSTLQPTYSSTIPVSLTLTETQTPTLTSTVEPTQPMATADEDLNCRRGPGIIYESLWTFLEGQTAVIDARNNDSTWLLISHPNGVGQCWISYYYVNIEGEITMLPIVTPPPTPTIITATPTPTTTRTQTEIPYSECGDYLDLATCNQDPMGFGGCYWDTGLNICKGP